VFDREQDGLGMQPRRAAAKAKPEHQALASRTSSGMHR